MLVKKEATLSGLLQYINVFIINFSVNMFSFGFRLFVYTSSDLHFSSYSPIVFITLAGNPTATELSGISFVTIEPKPISIVTPPISNIIQH